MDNEKSLKIGQDINKCSEYIKNGEIVVFPTETVYGIGANALDSKAVEKIFKAKNRPADNPLIVHISNYKMLDMITEKVSKLEKDIMNKFWPGPLSIILNKKENILPDNVTASLETIAVRMPRNKIALELIEKSNLPIAAPSANISSRPSGTNICDIFDELKDNISYFLQDGESDIGLESTVIKVIENKVIILRPGKITKKDLLEIAPNVELDKNCIKKIDNNEIVLSPGMKHKHYAPNVSCILIKINSLENIKKIVNSNEKIALLLTEKNIIKLNIDIIDNKNITIINLGNNIDDISKNLFKNLRKLNTLKLEKAYIQSFKYEDEYIAIMNRLIRTCEYKEIEI